MDEDQNLAIGVISILFGMMFICFVTYLFYIIKDCIYNRQNIQGRSNLSNASNRPNTDENVYEEIV
jgi:hypothetical protein